MTDIESLGSRHIARRDPVMAALIRRVGPLSAARRQPRFAALARTIVGQQVSTKAAASVYRRLRVAAGGHVTAERLDDLGPAGLATAGISRQKATYLADLARRVASGDVRLDRLHRLDDEQVIEQLTAIRGLGVWSAQMFLIFVLHRPDVLPVDDLGIQNAFQRAYGLRQRPAAAKMLALSADWEPYRSVGTRLLWRSLEVTPQ
ncbi:MAG: DNA-3-methyladenine glycosylase 2 family protein [Myxococcales bacterium FL481]|nr:MAG: DNA-3-methyladenine glycosylase 2 family protein [Myxococcales bacterium FL481]